MSGSVIWSNARAILNYLTGTSLQEIITGNECDVVDTLLKSFL